MTTLFYPVITFLLLTVCISYWAVTAVYPSDGSPVTTEKHIYILYVLQSSELRQSHAHCKVSVCETLQYPENRKLIFFSLTSTSYLASSGDAVYKVMSPDVSCPNVNSTCNPEVQYVTFISVFLYIFNIKSNLIFCFVY